MNQHDIAGGYALQALQHRIKVQLMGARIVVRIALEPQA
jgi:hypothetical protein